MEDAVEFFRDSRANLMAILIRAEYSHKGINFLTDGSAYQQVGFMGHPAGHKIVPHYHNKVKRIIDYTCETMVVRSGLMEVRLYEDKKTVHVFNMKSGDVITIFSGGHAFNMLEDTEMIEIKQGPYVAAEDKVRFEEVIP